MRPRFRLRYYGSLELRLPLAAIVIPAGFFLSMLPRTAAQPSGAVGLIYEGAVVLAAGVLLLGAGLIRSAVGM